MTWGEEVAQRRIARARKRRSVTLCLDSLGLTEVPAEARQLKALKGLHVSDNRINALPDWLPELDGLQQLRLRHNHLSQLPDWIGELPELRYLNFSGNHISELPRSLLRLRHLSSLSLSLTDVVQPPAWIARFPALQGFYLQGLPLGELPGWIASMTGLTELNLEHCGLESVPPWLADLNGLRQLRLSDNLLTEVPEALRSLCRLELLDISTNGIDRLPDWIGDLRSLRVLITRNNRLSTLPHSLGTLPALRVLDVSRNRLAEVPASVGALSRMTQLMLGGNRLAGAPEFLGRLARLRQLSLDGCSLGDVPESIHELRNLVRLWIGSNQLGSLPDWLSELTHLRFLSATDNRITALPETFSGLTSLEQIFLDNNTVSQFPPAIAQLSSLTLLSLVGNGLRSLPERRPTPIRVRHLYLNANGLTALPEWIGALPQLTSLNVADNRLTRVPGTFRGHRRLVSLDLDGNPIDHLPEWLGELPSLARLGIGSAELTEVPGWVRECRLLKALWIHQSNVTELPDWLGELRELEFLGMHMTPVKVLPDSLAQLRELRFLNLIGTTLVTLPDWIGDLTRLTSLYAGRAELAWIPESIGSLASLEHLYFSHSPISRLPSTIGRLRYLKSLRVENSRLQALPAAIGQLKRLETLELQNNRLTELPAALLDLPMLEDLKVHGNPLLSPPPEIGAAGTSAVLDFLAERKKGSAWQWESKLLVVGDGGVGKTSMIKRLIGEAFDPQESTTHGMRTYGYALAHPHHDGVTMTLNVWDFGGQEIYHATHQFFLTDRSLFLLLWNGRLGWEQGRLRYWLDIIKARAPESPVLLVATHSPVGGRPVDLPLDDLKREYPQIVDNLAIDNENADGMSGLVGRIGKAAASLPLMGTEWPRSWLDASASVRRISDEHVTPARLWRTMSDAGLVDVRHQHYVAGALHALGTILYYAEDAELRDTVIIRPAWVNEYISRVLDDPEVERRHGLLRRSRLDELWAELDRGMRDHFLAMMDKYDLSYKTGAEHGDDVSLVVERLSWQAPDYQPSWKGQGLGSSDENEHEIRVVYELSTMPPGIPTWFIARSHRFSTNMHWRTGALLAHPDGRHRALIRADPARKTVALAVRGPAPAGFFALLDDGLNLTLERYPGLDIRCMVPCSCRPDCQEFYDYRDLQRRMTRKKPLLDIECRKSYEMVHVPLLLLGLPPSERDDIRSALERITRQNIALDGRLAELAGDQQRMFLKLQQQIHAGLETKCPSVFAITEARRAGRLTKGSFELHLYCEEPGSWHPLPDEAGVYFFSQLPEWWARMAPHLRTIISLLKNTAPLVSPILGAACGQLDQRLRSDVELMAAVIDWLPAFDTPEPGRTGGITDPGNAIGPATPPAARASSEADYRALQNLLTELDPHRIWGGLSRVSTPEGLTLYLCPAHARSYEP